jgi:AcrR family transcriptional regulator
LESLQLVVVKRAYNQTARAAATETLRHKIVLSFNQLLLVRWIDEITLDEVAASAGTSRQTILRLFRSKEGLLSAAIDLFHAQAAPRLELPEDVGDLTAIEALVEHYEIVGDMAFRLLAQEERQSLLRPPLSRGRQAHRSWVAAHFKEALGGLDEDERNRQITRLVVATDLYTWKLLRRDFGQTRSEVTALIAGMVNNISQRSAS